MNNNLQLSVIIPVYNVEKYLKECLDSVSQLNKYIDCEIIVVNDGSTDSSETIIAEYLDNPVFKLINQPNKGLSGARNTGLKAACGKYVYILDSDDFIDAESFVKMFNAGYDKNVDIIIGEMFTYYSKKNINKYKGINIPVSKNTLFNNTDSILYEVLFGGVCRGIYRRECIIKNSLWFHEGVLFEDLEWMPQIVFLCSSILYVPTAFYYYRQRLNSIMNSYYSIRQINDSIIIGNTLNSFVATIPHVEIQKRIRYHIFYNILLCLRKNKDKINKYDMQRIIMIVKEIKPIYKYEWLRRLFIIAPQFVIIVIKNITSLKYKIRF